MHILHSIPSLVPESGGTARSVTGLCTALSTHGLEVEIVTLDLGSRYGLPITPTSLQVPVTFVRNHFAIGQRQLWSPQFARTLRHLIQSKEIELIHDHCIWLPTNLDVTYEAKRAQIPLVVSTRGMLEPWSLNHNRLRKQAMWHLYQARTLAKADVLHATAMSEAKHLRELNLKQPIAIIPNAVEFVHQSDVPVNRTSRSIRTLLFLSRIHPKKGLLNLIKALAQISVDGWELLIVGPDEGGHLREVQDAVTACKLEKIVKFVGPIDDQAKWQYYKDADLFILPSFSENFGLVVAEALACGIPVITTTGTPWKEVIDANCGWWVEPTDDALATALHQAMALTDDVRTQMGQNGRRLVITRYSWNTVAESMVKVYQWLLGQGEVPSCVMF